MKKKILKTLSSKELQPLQEFWINRYVGLMLLFSRTREFLRKEIYQRIEPILIVCGVVLIMLYEAIRDSRLIQKIKKFFSRFLLTDEESQKFYSP